MPVIKGNATYEDLVAVPDNLVAEIVDGRLHTSPRPAVPHGRAASRLGHVVGPPFDEGIGGPGGWWILDEPELHLADNVLVPDLAGWRRERMASLPRSASIALAPDWVCEVASPSTERFDRVEKLPIYRREKVGHVWLVKPEIGTLEVYRRAEAGWDLVATYGGEGLVRAEPFEAIEWDLSRLWGGLAQP
jgi:Uma2 family endonuclease